MKQRRDRVLKLLRRGHKGRRLRASARDRRNQAIPDMVLIDERPEEASQRLVPGHWEGDLLIGKGNRSQVGTLVERTTLFVALVKLDSARAAAVAAGFATLLNRFDSQLHRSLTYDQGTEMAHHKTLTEQTGIPVYFAHPHSPWQRGISENTNGLLRQYLPKEQTLAASRKSSSTTSHGCSIQDQERRSDGRPQQNSSSRQVPSTTWNTGTQKSPLHFCLQSTVSPLRFASVEMKILEKREGICPAR